MRTSSIEVTLDLARDVPPILADADQLHQVLLNLIINAQQSLQEQPPPRRIRVTSRFDARTGHGAHHGRRQRSRHSGAVRARVFEPYFTTKPTGIGTGVGLAVSLGIVEAHGGTLTVDCPAGGGAVVHHRAARRRASRRPTRRASRRQAAGDGERTILIVDDEAEIRETLAEILAGARHRVDDRCVRARGAGAHGGASTTTSSSPTSACPISTGARCTRRSSGAGPAGRRASCSSPATRSTSALREFVDESGRPVIEKPFLPSEVRRIVAEVACGAGARDAQSRQAPGRSRRPTQSKQQ